VRRVLGLLASLFPADWLLRLERRLARPPFDRGPQRRLLVSALSHLRRGELTIARGAGAGLRFDAAGQAATLSLGIHDPQAQRALRALLRGGMTFYDLGASSGFFTVIGARLVGPEGRVYAFEPIPRLADAVERNAAANRLANVTVVRRAVSDRSGPRRLALVGEGDVLTGSHLLAPGAGAAPPGESLPVEAAALDDLVRDGEIAPPDVVKMDVEGAELDALRGMAEIVRGHRPAIVAELHGDQSAFVALLAESGYEVVSLERGDGRLLTVNPQVLALPRGSERWPEASAAAAARG